MTTEEELERMLEIAVRQYNESADSIQQIVRQWQEIEHWMTSGERTTMLDYHAGLPERGPQQDVAKLTEHRPVQRRPLSGIQNYQA